MSTCEWKPTFIFPNEYMVSEDGRVKSIRSDKLLKVSTDKYGYLYYVLCVNGVRKTVKAHRLVAKAFIDNPYDKPAVDHINGDKKDNRACNLRWVTNKENSHNPITLDKLVKHSKENLPKMVEASIKRDFGRIRTNVYKDGELVGSFPSQKLAAEFTNVCSGKVSECVSGKTRSCKGFEFKGEIDNER